MSYNKCKNLLKNRIKSLIKNSEDNMHVKGS